jgi:hypothetical protein
MTPSLTVSPLITLYLTEKPAEMVSHYQYKSTLYCAAIVISAIGTLIIFGGISAMYLGLLSETSLSGMGVLVVMFGGCLFSHNISLFSQWQKDAQQKIKWYDQLNTCLQSISHWNERNIDRFFAIHHRSMAHIRPPVVALLHQLKPERPFLALLPLIARYQLTAQLAKEWGQKGAEQVAALPKIEQLPPESQGHIRNIHKSLEAQANKEKERCEQLNRECLSLLLYRS